MREKVTGRNYENKQTNCSQERNHQGGTGGQEDMSPNFWNFRQGPPQRERRGEGEGNDPHSP